MKLEDHEGHKTEAKIYHTYEILGFCYTYAKIPTQVGGQNW